MKKTGKVVWIVCRTILLCALAYPFALLIGKMNSLRTGTNNDQIFAAISFLGWLIFVPAFSFLIPSIIKGFQNKKLLKAILLTFLSVLLLIPLGYCIIYTLTGPNIQNRYFQLNLPDGQTLRTPIYCLLDDFPDSYSIVGSNTDELSSAAPSDVEVRITQNMNDSLGPVPSLDISIGMRGRWAFNERVDASNLFDIDDKGNGSFSAATIMFYGSKSDSTYTNGNPFYTGRTAYEFSGNWVCNP